MLPIVEEQKETLEKNEINPLRFSSDSNETNDISDSCIKFDSLCNFNLLSNKEKLYIEELENVLIILSKKQKKIINYGENWNLGFYERNKTFNFFDSLLKNINLSRREKISIFHRFCNAYDFIIEKIYINSENFDNIHNFKLFVVAIFLLTYKLEGASTAKESIEGLMEDISFQFSVDLYDLKENLRDNEIIILELLEFNIQQLNDNDINEISLILYELFIKKYDINISEDNKEEIDDCLEDIIKYIEYEEKINFKYLPVDKALITFYCSVEYSLSESKDVLELINEFIDYLRNDMKIIFIKNEDLKNEINRVKKEVHLC